jgi:hypothetical protein
MFKTGKPFPFIICKFPDPCSQMHIWDALEHLQPILKGGTSPTSWRKCPAFFKPDSECLLAKPGVVTMSPAWFEQGHDVCNLMSFTSYTS